MPERALSPDKFLLTHGNHAIIWTLLIGSEFHWVVLVVLAVQSEPVSARNPCYQGKYWEFSQLRGHSGQEIWHFLQKISSLVRFSKIQEQGTQISGTG